jgi:MFS family permease
MKQPSVAPVPFSPAYSWAVVAMLWLVCFFNYADRQAIFSVFPLLQKEMQLSSIQLGLLGSAFAWVYGLSGPAAGLLVDRFRRKSAILGGLEFWSVLCALSAFSRSFVQLLIFRGAEGLGESLYYPASTSLISDYHGKRTRSRALGVLVTSVYAGTVGGGLWAGAMAERHGWRMPLLALGLFGCLLGAILLVTLREAVRGSADDLVTPVAPPAPVSQTILAILKTPTVLVLAAVFVCANFVALVLLAWMPAYLYQRFHLTLAQAALMATIYPQLASMAGAFCGGLLADAWSTRTPRGRMLTQLVGVCVGIPFVVLVGRASTLSGVAAALVGWGFAKGMYDANIFASVFDVVRPQARGTVSGLMNCVGWLIGGGTAPLAIGFLSARIGLGPSISFAAVAYVCAAALLTFGIMQTLPGDVLSLSQRTENRASNPLN